MKQSIRAMAKRMAVGPDSLPVELLEILTDKGDFNPLLHFYDVIVAVRRGGRVP